MTTLKFPWVVCSPGDPTTAQWDALWRLTGADHGTMTEYNEVSGSTRCEIDRPDGATETYVIAPNGDHTREV